ncbi:Uma2 family endonuclease [Actinomadura rubrisoli]|uniref:Uma2 family endonuclease n=1 Tax=Actinomadura rubrisoli TaxID=2530368 RepID=A0A4R5AFA1_9ACTN|nr:Uma2 family endonuclease [Actinomadura rubrisoli]TDD70335.1 Uma2 family endonuclease [Actinomadura rubrisoli]
MSHTLLHQVLVSSLVVPVGLAQRPGHDHLTAFGTRLADDTWLRPDLMVYRKDQAEGDLWYIRGAPLLAVEVVSPSSREADLRAKRALYARHGVPSYWVVDVHGDRKPAILVHELGEDGRYGAEERVPWGRSHRLSRPFGIELAPEELFDRLPGRAAAPRRNPVISYPAAPRVGSDLPHHEDLFDLDVFGHRWPTGAEKVELWDGCPVFYGRWDERDVRIAERAYPGRVVRLDQPPGEPGTMTIMPAPAEGAAVT